MNSLKVWGTTGLLLYSSLIVARPYVLVTYYSVTGFTATMADAVSQGVQRVSGVDVKVLPIEKATFSDVKNAAGVILGTPVYNANVAPKMQEFINSWPLNTVLFQGKVGAAFVTAGGLSAGEEEAQMSLIRSMMIYNFIIVGGPHWRQPFGASAITNNPLIQQDNQPIHSTFLKQAEQLGRRVAELVLRLYHTQYSSDGSSRIGKERFTQSLLFLNQLAQDDNVSTNAFYYTSKDNPES